MAIAHPPSNSPIIRADSDRAVQSLASAAAGSEDGGPQSLAAEHPRFHALSAEDALRRLESDLSSGLSNATAAIRLARHGPNRLAEKPPHSAWLLFLGQFKSALILVLIFAAGLAAAIGHRRDASVILVVVVLNAIVGFYQEYRAERSLAALKKMLPARARVLRERQKREIAADELVPGDIALLDAGDRVPADGRIVLAASLAIDESALTGESQPADKQADPMADAGAPLAERINMAYLNTLVTRGRGELLVTGTGMQTEMGRLSQALAAAPESPSPLQIQLDQLGKRLGAVALTLVGLLFFLELLRGEDLTHVIIDAIALAVAAMPEGLPVVVTVTLALGMHRMAHQRAIVKRLASVETLGCTTVICSDKTGTLTMNQMTARAFFYRGQRYTVSGEGYSARGEIKPVSEDADRADLSDFLVPLIACNDSRVSGDQLIGDPTEGALLSLAAKGGIERESVAATFPRIAEIPFDSVHKFMATFHRSGPAVVQYVKGAPDVLLRRCTRFASPWGEVPMDAGVIEKINEEYASLASRGLRGLLIARRVLPNGSFALEGDLHGCVFDLTFIGLVGLMDPPRPEARQAIASCREAGIAVKMITGDHKDTASAIARELGLTGKAVSGADLDALDASQLADLIDEADVFARVAPEHKVKIVHALQAKGHVVAMTGDGVNDAPALKHADIGVAMGVAGTEVSKEAASMVLTDDNFATIVNAVRQGRTLYDNIVKFVRFQLSTTFGAILTVFFAPLAGLPEPFNPIQILWVALIMDGPPAVSLALDSARPGIMQEPPRGRGEPVLPLFRLAKILTFGITMMIGTLGTLYFALRTTDQARALTLAFTVFVLFQFFNVFNARVESRTSFNKHFFANSMLWWSLAGVLVLQFAAVHWKPMQMVFQTTALSAADWLLAFAVASSVLLLEEGRKLAFAMLTVLRERLRRSNVRA
jgi:P-type Ca2+ transporter type 2C